VSSFSLTSSCWRVASHSSGDTMGGVFILDSYQGSVVTSDDTTSVRNGTVSVPLVSVVHRDGDATHG
jgi:hypothetical protein